MVHLELKDSFTEADRHTMQTGRTKPIRTKPMEVCLSWSEITPQQNIIDAGRHAEITGVEISVHDQ